MNAGLPEVLEVRREAPHKLKLHLRLAPELEQFQGHFPEVAILPAVAQIDWALTFAAQHFGVEVNFRGMDRLKFRQVLLPREEPVLALELSSERNVLEFSYTTARGRHSSGQLLIA